MKKILFFIIILISFYTFSLNAKDYKVDEIPMVHLIDRTKYVSNPDGILDQRAVYAIDTTLYSLEQQTGIQTLVVVVTGIDGGDCFDFAQELGKKYGIGQKSKDNGLIILLSTDQRCIQFATGYGVEGALPDAICKRIQNRYMLPYFRQGNWNQGMINGVIAVRKYLDGSMENEKDDNNNISGLWTIAASIILFSIIIILIKRQNSRCPYCKKHNIQRISSRIISRYNGIITEEITYKCLNCGNIFNKTEKRDDDNFHGPLGGGMGPIIGGFGGFMGGRNSGGGGSFGGGSFGGGGSGSNW